MEIEFNFKADVGEITPIVQRVTEIAQEMHCEQARKLEIALALQEALANAVVHGCKCDASKSISCRVIYGGPNEMRFVIRDPGPGFDLSQVPSPKAGENLCADHGRGIYMIKQLMDEVSFAHGGSEIRFRAFITGGQNMPGVNSPDSLPQ